MLIEAKNLTRYYGKFAAVQKVNFAIGKQQIVGLLGQNGAGKTTIMKMCTGYLEPNEGEVLIDGVNILQNRHAAQAKIGYLPENCPLYQEMTIISYLEYVAQLKGIPNNILAKQIKWAMVQTDIIDRAQDVISTLSRGYKQRVGVAQAILGRPQLLILDEPTNGLDPTQIQQMRRLIKSLSKTCTIIISSHILQEIQAVCDRVIMLDNGQVALDAKLDELQTRQSIILESDIAMNLLSDILIEIGNRYNLTLHVTSNGKKSYKIYGINTNHIAVQQIIPDIINAITKSEEKIFAIYQEKRDLEAIFKEMSQVEFSREESQYAA